MLGFTLSPAGLPKGLSFLICRTGSLCSGSPYTRQRMAESDVSGPCDERDPAGLSLSSLPSRDKWAEKEEPTAETEMEQQERQQRMTAW